MLQVRECSYELLLFSQQVVKCSPGENGKQLQTGSLPLRIQSLWHWSCQQISTDRPKRVSSKLNGSAVCGQLCRCSFGEMGLDENTESQKKEEDAVTTRKSRLYYYRTKLRQSGREKARHKSRNHILLPLKNENKRLTAIPQKVSSANVA